MSEDPNRAGEEYGDEEDWGDEEWGEEEEYEGYYWDEATGQWVLEENEGDDTNGYDQTTHQSSGPQPSTPAEDVKLTNNPPPTSPLRQQTPFQQQSIQQQQQQQQQPTQQPQPPMTQTQPRVVQPSRPREDPPPVIVTSDNVAENLRPAQTKEEADQLRSILDRTYAFEDYEPRRNGWLADVSTEIFVSRGFKVYLGVLYLSGGCLVSCMLLAWLTAVLCAMFAPPASENSFAQSFGLLSLFIFMSLTAASVFCAWTDALKQLWEAQRTDKTLWGMHHPIFKSFARLCCRMCDDGDEAVARRRNRQEMAREHTASHSPWLIHLIVVGGLGIVPIIVAIIQTGVNSGNIANFISYLTFAGVMGAVCLQAILYIWFYIRALVEKSRAYRRRKSVEDESKKEDGRPSKQRWYSSQVVLEELGLDRRTLRWSIVMLIIGLVPVFSIFTTIALDNTSDHPPAGWIAIVVIFICVMLFIMELASMKRYYRAVVVALLLILTFAVAGLGCVGATLGAEMTGVIIAFIVGAQFGLVRKRPHELSRKEQCVLNVAIEKEEDEALNRRRKDTTFLCAKNAIFACLSCLDIHTLFGYKHPKVVERERAMRRSRVSLRVDYRVLVAHWWITAIIGVVILVGGRNSQESYSTPVSTAPTSTGTAVPYGQAPFGLCGINVVKGLNLTVVDFAALALLGHSTGNGHDVDFVSWFAPDLGLVRISPSTVEDVPKNSLGLVTIRHKPSNTYIVLARTPATVAFYSWFAGMWAPAISLGGLAYFSPVTWGWTNEQKESLTTLVGSLNNVALKHSDLMDGVAPQIEALKSTGGNVVIVGSLVNGAYAKLLARKHGVHFVAFNAAGTSLSKGLFGLDDEQSPSFDIQSKRNPYRFVDSDPLSPALSVLLPCPSDDDCVSSKGVFSRILDVCGDVAGRGIVL